MMNIWGDERPWWEEEEEEDLLNTRIDKMERKLDGFTVMQKNLETQMEYRFERIESTLRDLLRSTRSNAQGKRVDYTPSPPGNRTAIEERSSQASVDRFGVEHQYENGELAAIRVPPSEERGVAPLIAEETKKEEEARVWLKNVNEKENIQQVEIKVSVKTMQEEEKLLVKELMKISATNNDELFSAAAIVEEETKLLEAVQHEEEDHVSIECPRDESHERAMEEVNDVQSAEIAVQKAAMTKAKERMSVQDGVWAYNWAEIGSWADFEIECIAFGPASKGLKSRNCLIHGANDTIDGLQKLNSDRMIEPKFRKRRLCFNPILTISWERGRRAIQFQALQLNASDVSWWLKWGKMGRAPAKPPWTVIRVIAFQFFPRIHKTLELFFSYLGVTNREESLIEIIIDVEKTDASQACIELLRSQNLGVATASFAMFANYWIKGTAQWTCNWGIFTVVEWRKLLFKSYIQSLYIHEMVVRAYKHILQAVWTAVGDIGSMASSISSMASCLNLLLGTPPAENGDANASNNYEAKPTDDLSLLVALDEHGKVESLLYQDDGDGYEYNKGGYLLTTYVAERQFSMVNVKVLNVERTWKRPYRRLHVQLLLGRYAMIDAWGIDGEVVQIEMPECENTWEEHDELDIQFPSLHLEDKVRLLGGGNDRPLTKRVYVRRHTNSRWTALHSITTKRAALRTKMVMCMKGGPYAIWTGGRGWENIIFSAYKEGNTTREKQ